MKHFLFVFFLGGAAVTLSAAMSKSESCTMVNGVWKCESSSSPGGNIAAGRAIAVSDRGGSSTYQGAGTGNTYTGTSDVQESSSGDLFGFPTSSDRSYSDDPGASSFTPGWQGSSSSSSSSSGGSGVAYGYSSGGGSASSSSSTSGDFPDSFPGFIGVPAFSPGYPYFGGGIFSGGFAGTGGAFSGRFPGSGAFAYAGGKRR